MANLAFNTSVEREAWLNAGQKEGVVGIKPLPRHNERAGMKADNAVRRKDEAATIARKRVAVVQANDVTNALPTGDGEKGRTNETAARSNRHSRRSRSVGDHGERVAKRWMATGKCWGGRRARPAIKLVRAVPHETAGLETSGTAVVRRLVRKGAISGKPAAAAGCG